MHIINWKKTSDFTRVMDELRGASEECVIIVGRFAIIGWFHIHLIHALFPNKKITFISRDDRIKKLVKQLGYRVIPSIQEIDQVLPDGFEIARENVTTFDYIRYSIRRFFVKSNQSVRTIFPEKNDIFTVKHSSWYMLVLGIIIALLLMVGIVSLTSTQATIVITPQINIHNATKNVTFILGETAADTQQVPLRKHTFSFDLTKKYPIKTYDPQSLKRAHGTIKITNLNTQELYLIAQTRVVTDVFVFRLQRSVKIPAASDSQPGELTVSVVADPNGTDGALIGSRGNIPGNTTLVFPGLNQKDHELVRATSVGDFVGGEDTFTHILGQEEYASLEKTFREQLINEARDSVIHSFDPNAEYIPLPIADVLSTVSLNATSDIPVGTYAQEVSFMGQGTFDMYLYHVPTLRKILIQSAQNHLLENVESLVEISQSPPDIIAELVKTTDPVFTVKATAQLPLQILYDFNSSAGQKTLQNMLGDLLEADTDRVKKTLLNHPYIKAVDVRLTPFWVTKLPNSLEKIHIKVKE